ncbi:substrate-binding domain-containing protein [Oscillospiraceae bacterium LTW-04]|nr:substrate-binding domain-containing protein [Oscillospiraceae bacterium MB24-C1]
MKKLLSTALILAMVLAALAGCGASSSAVSSSAPASEPGFDTTKNIAVISREEGSGTRGAFIELIGIEQKNAEGKKIDNTTEEASITNSTSVMMTSVAGNPYGIGYISLGSLNETVKALKIDGAEATAENIKTGTYKVARPFNIVTKGDVSEVAQDFMGFILSADGQAVVEKSGYISEDAAGYTSKKPSGKVVVAGSSSVTPVMEKLKEAYASVNPNATIEVQQSDSTTGVNSALEGICDIGMASRELKDSEIEKGAQPTVIAIDGIAVVVNNKNTVNDLSTEQVLAIYTGEATKWNEVA